MDPVVGVLRWILLEKVAKVCNCTLLEHRNDLQEHTSERPHIGLCITRPLRRYFGGRISVCLAIDSAVGEVLKIIRPIAGDAEVADHNSTIVDEDVSWFDVFVPDFLRM